MNVVTKANIEEYKQADFAVLDFWATWCGPCRMLAPTLEALAEKYAGKVTFGKVNVDEEEALAISYGISVIPTLFFLKKGEVVATTKGVRSESELTSIIEDMLK